MMQQASSVTNELVAILRCPVTGAPLHQEGDELVTPDGAQRYPITASGIPLFRGEYWTREAQIQEVHYNRIAGIYSENLEYPHTQEYSAYLDRILLQYIPEQLNGKSIEICCGHGEAFNMLGARMTQGVGLDVSLAMLELARKDHPEKQFTFIQGDATSLPISDGQFDHVIMLGGIHHVNQRDQLFAEIQRILKPGGTFYWREPVSDFFLWRWLRAIVYRLSPTLDAETERPLEYAETKAQLEKAGFNLTTWQTCGFIGFMVLMNSDVLVFNRFLRFVPGVRYFAKFLAALDNGFLHLPGMKNYGLQVVGRAVKPGA